MALPRAFADDIDAFDAALGAALAVVSEPARRAPAREAPTERERRVYGA